MSDKVWIDKHELKALLERILLTTRDRECYDRVRQVMLQLDINHAKKP